MTLLVYKLLEELFKLLQDLFQMLFACDKCIQWIFLNLQDFY